MAFEFGMFHEFQRTVGVTDEEAFATSFDEIDAAERWGLDAMWLAEIHVNPERSVCSAPLTLAGAIAARTKRMKIGTANTAGQRLDEYFARPERGDRHLVDDEFFVSHYCSAH